MTTESKNLATALVAAQQSAQAVAKGSKNEFHKYKYASAEAIIEEARGALSSSGLALMAMGWRIEGDKIHVSYRLYHLSGENLDIATETTVVPDKGRPADKAEATALTYNLSYVLRALLLLPRVDPASEVDARNDGKAANTPTAEGAPAAAPTPTTEHMASVKEGFLRDIASAPSVDELTRVYTKMMASGLTNEEKTHLKGECTVRRGQLEAKP